LGDIVNEEVLVSFSFTPEFLNLEIILLIDSEFAARAAFDVLSVVSTPIEITTLSGFTFVNALPEIDNVLLFVLITLAFVF
jgi:hypothetical protein